MLATVVLVPSHDSRWAGLADILGTFDDLTILETAATPKAALAAAAHRQPTLFLLATDTGALAVQAQAVSPASKLIVIGDDLAPGMLRESVSIGVLGFVEWPFATTHVMRTCLNAVLAGCQFLTPGIAQTARQLAERRQHKRTITFTPDETSVLQHRAEGYELVEIAEMEKTSLSTVNRRMSTIRAKSGAPSDIVLGAIAAEAGLLLT